MYRGPIKHLIIRLMQLRAMCNIRGHLFACDAAKHDGVEYAITAQAIGAVRTAGILAGSEQPRQRSTTIRQDADPAHHVMHSRNDFYTPTGQIEA